MARNGSGTYSRVTGTPYVYNTVIDQVIVNNEMDDMATALTMSVAKDGQTTMTADLPMGNFKLTGLAAGTGNGHSVRYEQVAAVAIVQTHAATEKTVPVNADEFAIVDSEAANVLKRLTLANLSARLTVLQATAYLLGTVSGTDTILAAATPTLTAQPGTGTLWKLPAAAANTGAATLNIDSQGALSILRADGTALQANDIPAADYLCLIVKRSGDYVLLNPANLLTQELAQVTAIVTALAPRPFLANQFFPTF